MTNFFLKLISDINNRNFSGCEEIKKELEGKNFSIYLREQLKESNLSNDSVNKILDKCTKSSEKEILLMCSLLYTKIKNFEKAFDFAFSVFNMDPKNEDIKMLYINASFEQISMYLERSNFDEAEKLIDDIYERFHKTDSMITNHLFLLEQLIPAYKSINTKIEKFNRKIEVQQWKLIEILGLFSAVLAFIITNIQIATINIGVIDIIKLMMGMACVLVIFAITISYLFSNTNDSTRQKDVFLSFPQSKKFIALCLVIIVLLILGLTNFIF